MTALLVAAVLAAALATGCGAVEEAGEGVVDGLTSSRGGPPREQFEWRGRMIDYPTPDPDRSATPVLPPPPAAEAPPGSSAVLSTQPDGTPVAWDPCRAMKVVLNEDGAPAGSEAVLRGAIAAMSEAAGLEIVVEGSTDEPPRIGRPPVLADRYGDRWAPVLIAWADPDESLVLIDAEGLADPAAVSRGSEDQVYVSGSIVLNRGMVTRGGPGIVRQVVLHELGHVLGLDHVGTAGEIMQPTVSAGLTGLGPGDRAGLAALRQGRCFPFI